MARQNYIFMSVMITSILCIVFNFYGIEWVGLEMNITMDWTLDMCTNNDSIESKQSMMDIFVDRISSFDYKSFNSDIEIDDELQIKHLSPSLVIDAFSDKTIIFFGDSTMYRFYVFLIFCLQNTTTRQTIPFGVL